MTHPQPGEAIRFEWTTSAQEAGDRLDRAVAAHARDVSRSYAATLIDGGKVFVNAIGVTRPSHRLKDGDVVSLIIPPPQPGGTLPEDIPLTIVYEDSDLLVVDKAAGMVVHPSPGHNGGTLVNAVMAHVPGIELQMGDTARPGIVHRLDKDTSGLMVVAKRRAAHEALAKQMASREMLKEYLVLVMGTLRSPAGVIDAPIARDPRDRLRMAIVEGGRPARTRFETVQRLGNYSLVRATLETGRTHQIRVHMAGSGHPVMGDPIYGRRTLKDAAQLGLTRQFLHSAHLGLKLPSSGDWREFTSALPDDLQATLDALVP